MDCWIPLFDIFLNSSCPETDASLWLQKNFNPSSNTTPVSTASFISLLTRPSDNDSIDPSSPEEKRVMWIETLPGLVQARILSFLAYEHKKFCNRDLCKLARIMLSESKGLDFWVKKAAQQLLDLVSVSNYQWLSHLNLDSEEQNVEDEFYSVPDWLREVAKDSEPMFPWLPIPPDEQNDEIVLTASEGNRYDMSVDADKSKKQEFDEIMKEVDVDESSFDEPIDIEFEKVAKSLKSCLPSIDSTSKAIELANEIRKLCFAKKTNPLAVLDLIEPWRADDESAAILISQLSDENESDELGWPSHILCSIILPKFLILNEPSSRVLVSATVEYCKAHQKAAEYALLCPLILRKEGIDKPICDVVTRIVKECLHPAHVSAFCQKLLHKDKNVRRVVCLLSHRCLIGEELVWTESLFSLWQNILNHNVCFMQDSVDQFVERVCEFGDRYSKSLKFGNFVLLTAAVENTDTLVTKSILSKLSCL